MCTATKHIKLEIQEYVLLKESDKVLLQIVMTCQAGIRKVRKRAPSNCQSVFLETLYNFPVVTAIKSFVDAYTLRLISRRCKDHRHYAAMVRNGLLLSRSTDPHPC